MWSSTICKKTFSEGIIKDFTSCQQVMQRKVEETSLFQFCKRYVNFWVFSDRIKLNLLSFWFYSLIFFYKFTKMSDNAPPALLEYAHLKMVSKCCGLKTTWWIKHQRMKYGIFPVSILMHVIMKAKISVANWFYYLYNEL